MSRKFVSKAQQAWAFANKKSFARRKAVEGKRYKALPRRKGKK